MPKKVFKIERFDGGLNTGGDARDIGENELAAAVDVSLDTIGKIRPMGSNVAHDAGANVAAIKPGYGLHYFSHDRTGAQILNADYDGTHTNTNNNAGCTDTSASFPVDALIGFTVTNVTDGSTALITDNAATTITGSLSGGTGDDWDTNDVYFISKAPETGDDYLLMVDADGAANIDVYSKNLDSWETQRIDFGSTTGAQVIFYDADGAVRISDSNFGSNNQNKWFGYISQTHFDGTVPGTTADEYDRWYAKNLDLAAPTEGFYGEHSIFASDAGSTTTVIGGSGHFTNYLAANIDGKKYLAVSTDGSNTGRIISARTSATVLTTETNSGNFHSENIVLWPPAGAGWGVYIKSSSSNSGQWKVGRRVIGSTFIYQGGQESQIFNIKNHDASAGTDNIVGGKALEVKIYATSPFDPFIIGGRIYIRESDTDDDWVLLIDISLKEGIRMDLTSSYTAWVRQTAGGDGDAIANTYMYSDIGYIENPSPWTYQKINGYHYDESIDVGGLGEGFKTAVVANRQTYIGNVRREHPDGVVRTEGDAMYKSMPGKFDTFPFARKIEASVQDGDEIVKLESYADRILQFKKHKVHVINIAQDIEFLEDTFMHKGVATPGAVCKTDFGIAWVNENGVYLYDGKQVHNLLEREKAQTVSEAYWRSFVGASPLIGYIPKERQIIILKSAGSEAVGNIFLFDIVQNSWVEGDTKFTDSVIQSNLIVDYNQDLVHAHTSDTGTILKWSPDPKESDTFAVKTKDIDFGQPSVRKKIYKVYVSYKGDGRTVDIQYSINGDNSATAPFYRTLANGSSNKTNSDTTPLLNVGTDDWVLAELRPVSSINNVYSFQLIFDGTSVASFEINDISIIYRNKNIK